MDPARWAITALAVVGAISASIGLYRIIAAQRRADRFRAARAGRSAELDEMAESWAANPHAGFGEDMETLSGHLAEAITLASPGDDEIPRTTRGDWGLLAVGLVANTAAALIGVVA